MYNSRPMNITIKNKEEIEKMRAVGKITAGILKFIEPYIKAGITTIELNDICHKHMIEELKVIPAPLNYRGFTKSICTSVNHQVCHSTPTHKKLKKGDIINIDITIIKDLYHGDSSRMFFVGKPKIAGKRVSDISYECLKRGIRVVKPGIKLSLIGKTIESYAKKNHCSVVEDYCGHGIGLAFHEEPQVLHYFDEKVETVLEEGMTFTIEPMINIGKKKTLLLADNWTVVTADHSLSAQWEHTILVTKTGYEVLTLQENETI
ncbi:MAG: type I methionyl aminopeptidase [Gammaproteobacteria bacterium]|nr:MAG: type I methionyl aminopeptidase [Gammaproteobacteria bacterium]